MVNFAVIGTNFVTDSLIDAGRQCEGFHVQAVYSRTMKRAKEYAKKYQIEDCYDSLEQLARAKNIDAVYVASPNAFHAKQSIQMLNAGKHVLCEKNDCIEFERIKRNAFCSRKKSCDFIGSNAFCF